MSNDRKGTWPHRFPLNDPERPYRGLFGNTQTTTRTSDWLVELAKALEARQRPPRINEKRSAGSASSRPRSDEECV